MTIFLSSSILILRPVSSMLQMSCRTVPSCPRGSWEQYKQVRIRASFGIMHAPGSRRAYITKARHLPPPSKAQKRIVKELNICKHRRSTKPAKRKACLHARLLKHARGDKALGVVLPQMNGVSSNTRQKHFSSGRTCPRISVYPQEW